MLEVLGIIGGIVLVDLVLSGDNALVIGAAAFHSQATRLHDVADVDEIAQLPAILVDDGRLA